MGHIFHHFYGSFTFAYQVLLQIKWTANIFIKQAKTKPIPPQTKKKKKKKPKKKKKIRKQPPPKKKQQPIPHK